jgi:hypothetical protein
MAEDPTIPILNIKASALPLVLVGPILRRVEKHSVSVFVVFSRKVDKVTLAVLSGLNAPEYGVTSPLQGETNFVPQFGDYLFATVVTAVPVNGIELVSGRLYHYGLTFEVDGVSKTLFDEGVLLAYGDTSVLPVDLIAYGDDQYPSFVAPVNNLDKLNIVHGSCRKPHGGEIDALIGLDVMLDYTYDSEEFRPQQLFLTGDQIYGDDVADVIRYMGDEIMPVLLGYQETLPLITSSTVITPGSRDSVVREIGGLTCFDNYGKSHSMRFGDYAHLYLIAWSDVLWPAHLPGYLDVHPVQPVADFQTEVDAVKRYSENMRRIRKVMANIATLTVFDDHEICDDWFLNRRWVDTVLHNELGSRIVQNGLSAFAIFQAWGNTPERFEQGTLGREILNCLTTIHAEGGATLATWSSLGGMILPSFVEYDNKYAELTGGMRWDYAVRYEKYTVMALNTRTNRAFYGKDDLAGASLLSVDAMQVQVNDNWAAFVGSELLILISGAPVFGHTFLEETVQPFAVAFHNYNFHDEESDETGQAHYDYEAWLVSRDAFESLLSRLANFERVIILSGDVHYAFSATINYWDKRFGLSSALEKRATFVQLTSSALKNSEFKTRNMTVIPLLESKYLGWTDPGTPFSFDSKLFIALSKPIVQRTDEIDVLHEEPQWEYKVNFHVDTRPYSERGFPEFFSTIEGWEGPTIAWERSSALESPMSHKPWQITDDIGGLNLDFDVQVVGADNIGQVTLEWSGAKKIVRHYLWSNPTMSNYSMQPFTLHVTTLDIKPYSDARPSSSLTKDY